MSRQQLRRRLQQLIYKASHPLLAKQNAAIKLASTKKQLEKFLRAFLSRWPKYKFVGRP